MDSRTAAAMHANNNLYLFITISGRLTPDFRVLHARLMVDAVTVLPREERGISGQAAFRRRHGCYEMLKGGG